MKLSKLPVITVGDFNITYETFANSGWCERLGVVMKHPGVSSTTLLSNDRVIDFVLYPNILDELVSDVSAVTTVPWWPHVRLLITLNSAPRTAT